MLALLLALALFVAWALVGLGALAAIQADVRELRVALTAPALGTALTVLPLFALNNWGVPLRTAAWPVGTGLLVAALVLVILRRPHLSRGLVPVLLLCVVDLLLLGRPLLSFGFDWIGNANGDMAVYVLAATHLLDHGLHSPIDLAALVSNRDFSSSIQSLHLIGLRPGAEIGLAGMSVITRQSPLSLYMPMILALNMCGIAAAGALAMQGARRSWAAPVAAALLVASPLAAYGVLQQLMPQVWGLGLALALFAWLVRPEMHMRPGPPIKDMIVVTVLVVALFVVYVELAASLAIAYGAYVGMLAAQRRVSLRSLAVLWGVPLVATVVVVNTFLPLELGYLHGAASNGVGGVGGVRLFGYSLVPTALPGVAGLQQLFGATENANLGLSIIAAGALFVGAIVICLSTARRGAAASIVVLTDLVLGVVLAVKVSDFGLFKLYMYVQPFLAVAVAVWLAELRRKMFLIPASALVVAVVGVQLSTLNLYVEQSRKPADLPHASAPDLLPAFRSMLADSTKPVVSVTDNFVLGFLEAASADGRPLQFVSRNFFAERRRFAGQNVQSPWTEQVFPLVAPRGKSRALFEQNGEATPLLVDGRCMLSIPTGSQLVLNRRSLPEGSPALAALDCDKARNLLIFTVSSLGETYFFPGDLRAVSFWQLEPDYFHPSRTISGFGRYALLELFRPTANARLALDLTTTLRQDGSNKIPPVSVVGAKRTQMPVVGRGSARVFSEPLQPMFIGGRPYVMIDMGADGRFPPVRRPGLAGLWGRSVLLDPRKLTSYLRDVSLVSSDAIGALRAPTALSEFPEALSDQSLEYSGMYEDGWVAERSYAMLSSKAFRTLIIRANVLPRPGQRLDVLLDGKKVASRDVAGGDIDLQIPVEQSAGRRRVELRWAVAKPISDADRRPAAARLTFLGFASP